MRSGGDQGISIKNVSWLIIWLFLMAFITQEAISAASPAGTLQDAKNYLLQAKKREAILDYPGALALYQKALTIQLKMLGREHPHTAATYNNIGFVYHHMGDYAQALKYYQQGRAIREKALGREHPDTAQSFNNIGAVYHYMGDYAQALEYYQQARAIKEKARGREHSSTAISYNNIGAVYERMGDYAQALEYYQQSRAIKEKVLGKEHPDTANSYNNIGAVYYGIGDYAQALKYYKQSRAIREKARGREHPDTAQSYNNIGLVYDKMGDYAQALEYYQHARAIEEKTLGREHPDTATSYNNIGAVYYGIGDYAQALKYYQQSRAIREKALGREHPDTAQSYNNIGAVYYGIGDYAQALKYYQQSRAIREKALGRAHPSTANSYNNIGAVYHSMGDYAQALEYYQHARAIEEKTLGREHPDTAQSYNNIGAVYKSMGDYAQALEYYQHARAIEEKTLGRAHPSTATSYNNIGVVYSSMGDYAQALEYYQQARAIKEKTLGREHPSTAASYCNIGSVYGTMGDYAQALEYYAQALPIAQNSGDVETKWYTLAKMAITHTQLNNPAAAIFFGKQAVNTIQGMRQQVAKMDKELQKSFLKDKVSVYKELSERLVTQGRLPEAQQVLAMLKQEEYFDFVRRDQGDQDKLSSRTAYTAAEQPWEQRYQAISAQIAALGKEQGELKQKAKQGELSEAEKQRQDQLKADMEAASRAFAAYLTQVVEDLSRKSGAEAAKLTDKDLQELKSLQSTLKYLGNGAVIIYYLVTDKKLISILTTPETQLSREVDIDPKTLNTMITELRQVLQDPQQDPRPAAQKLYQVVLAPLAQDLQQAQAQTLMVSLDGALRYIPLAALYDGQQYLLERYTLAVFTPASRDKLKDEAAPAWKVAGFGVVGKVSEKFSALPAVREELWSIVEDKANPGKGVLPGEVRIDGQFTREEMQKVLNLEFPVVHIASHFHFTPGGTDLDSYLLLGDGSPLTLDQLKHQDFKFAEVDLLTLSACETAVGGATANGREIEGLGVLAQRQGAKGVIATLWPVADQSTALLMRQMYEIRTKKPGTTKAAALRQAQLALLTGQVKPAAAPADSDRAPVVHAPAVKAGQAKASFTPNPQAPYAHPFYWAPFILMGNWR